METQGLEIYFRITTGEVHMGTESLCSQLNRESRGEMLVLIGKRRVMCGLRCHTLSRNEGFETKACLCSS